MALDAHFEGLQTRRTPGKAAGRRPCKSGSVSSGGQSASCTPGSNGASLVINLRLPLSRWRIKTFMKN